MYGFNVLMLLAATVEAILLAFDCGKFRLLQCIIPLMVIPLQEQVSWKTAMPFIAALCISEGVMTIVGLFVPMLVDSLLDYERELAFRKKQHKLKFVVDQHTLKKSLETTNADRIKQQREREMLAFNYKLRMCAHLTAIVAYLCLNAFFYCMRSWYGQDYIDAVGSTRFEDKSYYFVIALDLTMLVGAILEVVAMYCNWDRLKDYLHLVLLIPVVSIPLGSLPSFEAGLPFSLAIYFAYLVISGVHDQAPAWFTSICEYFHHDFARAKVTREVEWIRLERRRNPIE